MAAVDHKTIQISSKFNAKSGLIAACSDDFQGLLVIGKSISEIEQKLPGAVRELLEALGYGVTHVDILPGDGDGDTWESSPKFRVEVNYIHAA